MPENLTYYVINIKLQTSKQGDERTNAYVRLIERISSKPYKYFEVSKNEAIVLYSFINTKSSSESLYLYGRAAKGMYVPGNERTVLKDGELNTEANNPNDIINPVITRCLFYSKRHRLFIEKKVGGPSGEEIEAYLKKELPKLLVDNDKIVVELEKDLSAIEEIFSAKIVHSISYKVTYSNEDFLDELAEELDQELKATNTGELTVIAKSDNNAEGLKIQDSKILGGGIKLAENNGEIRNASITPNDGTGKKKTVKNKAMPKLFKLKISDADNFWKKWYDTVVNLYNQSN
ncbi:MAG TPA: DUF4747 family protein [Mucilaginibacter sp.]|jgi:hypothetical protein|nr:DUF4747 family protein [Mucilaginibacter sp.]